MGFLEKKIHLLDMSNLSILFKAQFKVSYSLTLRITTSLLEHSFRIFSPATCTERMISHGHRVSLILFCNTSALRLLVTTHRDYRPTQLTNISLVSGLWPHSCAPRKTSQEVTHPKIAHHQARLTLKALTNELP